MHSASTGGHIHLEHKYTLFDTPNLSSMRVINSCKVLIRHISTFQKKKVFGENVLLLTNCVEVARVKRGFRKVLGTKKEKKEKYLRKVKWL